ncbi:MAG: DNA (cytosine-5-)-methyltransferase [Candidatus Nanopelagicaceae bacterium]|nr:DNA (cytosine-5-)-methyltransferase [Candidatus Nanopelagicaceae bacterium]
MPFTFVDLFAGIGGFHAALQGVGGRCVFVSEIDKKAMDVYLRSWGEDSKGVPPFIVTGDIKLSLNKKDTMVPKHDVLTAGFPCQSFSKSGHQKGINEARGTLFWSIAKVLEHRAPKLVLLENVRNLYGPRHREDYLTMIGILRNLGYAVSEEPTILSPHQLPKRLGGSPQHRERLFIAACQVGSAKRAHDLADIPPLLSKADVRALSPGNWNIDQILRKITEAQIPNEAKLTEDEAYALDAWDEFVHVIRSSRDGYLPSFPIWTEYFRERGSIRIPSSTPDWKRQFIESNSAFYERNKSSIRQWERKYPLEHLTNSKRKFEWQAGDATSLDDTILQFRPSGLRAKKRNYAPALVAITQTTILGRERRRLVVEEAARLQGFGRSLDFGVQESTHSFRQLGNAVHVGVAQYIFNLLQDRGEELGVWNSQQKG